MWNGTSSGVLAQPPACELSHPTNLSMLWAVPSNRFSHVRHCSGALLLVANASTSLFSRASSPQLDSGEGPAWPVPFPTAACGAAFLPALPFLASFGFVGLCETVRCAPRATADGASFLSRDFCGGGGALLLRVCWTRSRVAVLRLVSSNRPALSNQARVIQQTFP